MEGKDVTSNIAAIEALFAEIESRIPKYTTDPSLAEDSLAKLQAKKALFDKLKEEDLKTLEIKADNVNINASISETCAKVQSAATANMEAVKKSVSAIILAVLVISVAILAIIVVIIRHYEK